MKAVFGRFEKSKSELFIILVIYVLAFLLGSLKSQAESTKPETKQQVKIIDQSTDFSPVGPEAAAAATAAAKAHEISSVTSTTVATAPTPPLAPRTIYALLDTSKGPIKIKLQHILAPRMTQNFISLAEGTRETPDPTTGQLKKRKFYDGLTFHRIVKDFVIQGGDPKGDGTGGPGGPGVKDEIVKTLKHSKPGIVAMANAGPNTNGSQFYITLAPLPRLDGTYSVFGEVVEGMGVVKAIANVKTDMGTERPIEKVVINSVKIIRDY